MARVRVSCLSLVAFPLMVGCATTNPQTDEAAAIAPDAPEAAHAMPDEPPQPAALPGDERAAEFMAHMDSLPPEERVPNWDEIRALMMRPAPRVGDLAPDFTLTTCAGDDTIRLSEFEPNLPVVMIFGSWT